ncbi:MAG: UbiA prenyltransferase family protein [Planctomycetota bacterium]
MCDNRPDMFLDLLRLARPTHWVKNLFLLLPVPFAVAAGSELHLGGLALGLLGFSLVSSSVYVLNDLVDAPLDRTHPAKRRRPLAAGRISRGAAVAWSMGLLAAGSAVTFVAREGAALPMVELYVIINILYTFGLKHIPLVDIFLLASGFLLRVLAGCALLGAAPSSWLLLCGSALALFLALSKRRVDLGAGLGAEHRPSLAGYSLPFLDQGMGIAAAVALLSYALYCMDSQVLLEGREFASVPLVAFGIFSYLRRVQVEGGGGSPVEILLRSPALLLTLLGWGVTILWSLGAFSGAR